MTGYCAAIASLALGQALFTWAWEACTEAAARRTRAAVRRWALAAALDPVSPIGLAGTAGPSVPVWSRADEPLGPGGVTTLIGSEIDELDPFVARVLPRTVLALAVPALLLAWIGHLDLVSAALAAVTLVIAPVLAGLVGADTAAAVRHRLASLERLGDRFDTLVEGLPLLRAFGRAADHERAVAASGEQVRTATLATLRIALLAGLVLELLAAVGTALVAVRLGLRLDAGQRILPQALAVLILVPEVFLPLRRLTADFHAGATGRAVLARLGGLTVTERVSRAAAAPPPASSWRECASWPKAGACRCWTGSTCGCPPGSGCAWSARVALARRACFGWWRVSSRPRRAGCTWKARCPRRAGSRSTLPSCPRPSWRTSHSAGQVSTSASPARSSK